MGEALFTTVRELCQRENPKPNERSVQSCHLHFNGPGASGFGVKRTAMLLPESAMLLVAPACCGRHGTVTGAKTGFEDRIFYLQMDERDLVTGAYLKRIPEAARRIMDKGRFKALFVCMTCVDAMLGTDLKRIGREIQKMCPVPVVACYMDPISREGKQAPMVSVQRSIMDALEKREMDPNMVNLIGNFVPLDQESDLFDALKQADCPKVGQISACETYEEYQKMAGAKLNIVIAPQAKASAEDLEKRLGIPYVQLFDAYGPSRVAAQYEKLSEAMGTGFHLNKERAAAEAGLRAFVESHPGMKIAIGEAITGNPLELAETLLEAGLSVPFVLRNIVTAADLEILKRLNERWPELRIYSGVHPSMKNADLPACDLAIGLDAGYFVPGSVSLNWSMERQGFGYWKLTSLLIAMEDALAHPRSHKEQMHGSYLTV